MNFLKKFLFFFISIIQIYLYSSQESLEQVKNDLEKQYDILVQEETSKINVQLRIIFLENLEHILTLILGDSENFINSDYSNKYLNLFERFFMCLLFRVNNNSDLFNKVHPLRPENFSKPIDLTRTELSRIYYIQTNSEIKPFDPLSEIDKFHKDGRITFLLSKTVDSCPQIKKYLDIALIQPDPENSFDTINLRLHALLLFVCASIEKLKAPDAFFMVCGHNARIKIDPERNNETLSKLADCFKFRPFRKKVPKGAIGASLENEDVIKDYPPVKKVNCEAKTFLSFFKGLINAGGILY